MTRCLFPRKNPFVLCMVVHQLIWFFLITKVFLFLRIFLFLEQKKSERMWMYMLYFCELLHTWLQFLFFLDSLLEPEVVLDFVLFLQNIQKPFRYIFFSFKASSSLSKGLNSTELVYTKIRNQIKNYMCKMYSTVHGIYFLTDGRADYVWKKSRIRKNSIQPSGSLLTRVGADAGAFNMMFGMRCCKTKTSTQTDFFSSQLSC